MSETPEAENGEPKGKRRACCIGGERHRWWGHWRYAYIAGEEERYQGGFDDPPIRTGRYSVTRHRDWAASSANTPRHEFLCNRGHWSRDATVAGRIVSEREAANIVRRLNSGLPIHRDRWLAGGGAVLVISEAIQAVRAIWPKVSEVTVEVVNTLPQ